MTTLNTLTTLDHLHTLAGVLAQLLDDLDPDTEITDCRPAQAALHAAQTHLLELAGQQRLPGLEHA